MRVPELMCDPGSNVSGTSYSQQLKIKPPEFFYFDFIIDTILLYFFNGYGSIRYVDAFMSI
jgi:hypothetical protein